MAKITEDGTSYPYSLFVTDNGYKLNIMGETAVEWLVSQQKHGKFFSDEIIEQAKAMEKEQIINSYVDGQSSVMNFGVYQQAEQYYNKAFNK